MKLGFASGTSSTCLTVLLVQHNVFTVSYYVTVCIREIIYQHVILKKQFDYRIFARCVAPPPLHLCVKKIIRGPMAEHHHGSNIFLDVIDYDYHIVWVVLANFGFSKPENFPTALSVLNV